MQNIFNIKDCYGCGVCAAICPDKIIQLDLDENGFYRPKIISRKKCTDCGLCLSVCAYSHNELACEKHTPIDAYAAWSNDGQIRRKSSSGGIGFELGKRLIETGHKACGARYNVEANRAEHYVAATVEEFAASIGSKYIQSYTADAFSQFDKKEKYFVTGTPCQIDSLRRFFRLKKMDDRVILMDIFCHGVPSMLLWKKYLKPVEQIIGKITYVSWRNKQNGWHTPFVMEMTGETRDKTGNESAGQTSYVSMRTKGDLFYKMFLNNSCLGKSCYGKCKYKAVASSADIRAGDFWGKTYLHDDKGVSCVVVFTEKGQNVIDSVRDKVSFIRADVDDIIEKQLKKTLRKPYYWNLTIKLLRGNMSLKNIHRTTKLFRMARIMKLRFKKIWKKR